MLLYCKTSNLFYQQYFVLNWITLCLIHRKHTSVSHGKKCWSYFRIFCLLPPRLYIEIKNNNSFKWRNYIQLRANSGITWFDDNVVSIVTRLRVGRCRIQIPARTRDFTLLEIVQIISGSHPASHSMSTGSTQPGREADHHSPAYTVEVNNERN